MNGNWCLSTYFYLLFSFDIVLQDHTQQNRDSRPVRPPSLLQAEATPVPTTSPVRSGSGCRSGAPTNKHVPGNGLRADDQRRSCVNFTFSHIKHQPPQGPCCHWAGFSFLWAHPECFTKCLLLETPHRQGGAFRKGADPRGVRRLPDPS